MPKSFSLRNLCGHCASAVSLHDKERIHRRGDFRSAVTGKQVREGDL